MSDLKKLEQFQLSSNSPFTENQKINRKIKPSIRTEKLSPSLEESLDISYLAELTNNDWKSISKIINFHFFQSRKARSPSDCKKIWKESKKPCFHQHRSSDTQTISSTYNKFKEQTIERKNYFGLAQCEDGLENTQKNTGFSPLQSFRLDDLSGLFPSFSHESAEVFSANALLDSFCLN